jgi:hypothetical protein
LFEKKRSKSREKWRDSISSPTATAKIQGITVSNDL